MDNLLYNKSKLKEYIIYSWEDVSLAANRLYQLIGHSNMSNAIDDIYDGNLPRLIEYIFIKCFLYNINREDNDIQILINAYKQLHHMGYIGKK